MNKNARKINKLAYLGLLGYIGILLALYTKDDKWYGLVGFFPFLNYFRVKQN